MFSRLINSIREQFAARHTHLPDRNIGADASNSDNDKMIDNDTSSFKQRSRSSSVTEELQRRSSIGSNSIFTNNDEGAGGLSKYTTAQSVPIPRKNSITSGTAGLGKSGNGNSGRRMSTNLCSGSAYDDYVQKDLMSSSWT
ncbi:hypothetical protein BDF20DRAFT_839427 [Mycotypha africana]|uniref:uncharacterized protein n=1 Tax=Mycotypha africana TaxID=64632 RepID=UPI00230074A3|nr:uncharacterized protein BDF20DRAFT_839427 [Mycotypha africana]KAI8968307.1 hypothetical protein BDF20DRAFT_839427 [Mycotypha africana]